ncbi:M14 family metallopeptidase, partial [Bacillus paranthracis]|uniref:M14 family metallopeptidase n=1 Tax=Bacillus paranthracis TaxID=2026186 RepID=UPI00254F6B6C
MEIILNRWGNTAQDREFRNTTNQNWDQIEKAVNTASQQVSKAVAISKVQENEIASFVETSSNMFNKFNVSLNTGIDTTTGQPVNNATVNLSEFIKMIPGSSYTVYNYAGRIAFYDENKIFISSTALETGSVVFTPPPRSYYLRMVVQKAYMEVTQLNKGIGLLPFETYYKRLNKDLFGENNLSSEMLVNLAVTQKIIGTTFMMNFDINKLSIASIFLLRGRKKVPIPDATLDMNDGFNVIIFDTKNMKYKVVLTTMYDSSNVLDTDYIIGIVDTKRKDVYFQGSVYNSNIEKMSNSLSTNAVIFGNTPHTFDLLNKKITIQVGGALLHRNMRFPLPPATIDILPTGTQQVLFWDTKTLEYQVKVSSDLGNQNVISKDNVGIAVIDMFNLQVYAVGNYKVIKSDDRTNDKHVLFAPTPIPKTVKTPSTGFQTDGTGIGGFKENAAPFTPLDKVYSNYDELMNSTSQYITKTLLGKDATGQHDIYKYTFVPVKPRQMTTTTKLPKLVFISNLHGHEKITTYSLYRFMRAICNDWKTDETLEYLRWNVEFVIIPVANPAGFVNNTRVNGNGVDLNRNFDYKWEEYVPGNTTDPLLS